MLMHDWLKKLWVAELRSERYKQSVGYLHVEQKQADGSVEECFCVQGVLGQLVAGLRCPVKQDRLRGYGRIGSDSTLITYDGLKGTLPPSVLEFAGMMTPGQDVAVQDAHDIRISELLSELGRLNDQGWDFKRLADRIEQVF